MGAVEISDINQTSGRIAHLVYEGPAIWMYLTDSSGGQIIADCWIQNQISAPNSIDAYRAAGSAPPATREFVRSADPQPNPDRITFLWAHDGGAVAVNFDGRTMGFIDCRSKFGFSRNLIKQGPYGIPFDSALFESLFGHPAGDA